MVRVKTELAFEYCPCLESVVQFFKRATPKLLTFKLNLCAPSIAIFIPMYAGMPALVVLAFFNIVLVFKTCNIAQIFKAVIASVSVNVIYREFRPFSSFHQPNDSMRFKGFTAKDYLPVTNITPSLRAARFPSDYILTRLFPKDFSALRAVCKNFMSQSISQLHLGGIYYAR